MQSKLLAVLLILYAILSNVEAQGDQPNGMSIVGTTSFPGLGTIRAIAYANATGTDVYYIAADHILYKVTGSLTNVASRTTIWTGAAVNDTIISLMVDSVTNNLFICTSYTRTIRRFNLLNDLAANVRLATPGISLTVPWMQCVLDTPGTGSPGGIIWIAGGTVVASMQTIYSTTTGSGTFKSTGVSSSTAISTVTVDDSNVYWGAAAGRVLKTPKTNRNLVTASVTFKVLSIGAVLASGYNPKTGLLYFSSDTSLVSEIKASTFGFARIYPENNVQFPVMALDTTNNAMVLAAYDITSATLYFYRVSLSGDQMERYATVTAGTMNVSSVFIDSTNRMMYWGATSGNLVGLSVANCARTCLDCSNDPDYCGFCLSSRTCTGYNGCSASNWRRFGNYECPVLTTVTPSSGSTAGGTTVKIGGSFLLDGSVIDGSVVNCVIDSKSVSSTSVTFSEVTCQTPSRTQSTATATVDSYVTWNNVPWADNTVPFQYYKCESYGSDCATCFANPECGLCGATGTCSASRSCSTGWTTVCPTITSFSPTSSSILGGVTITVTVSPSIVTSVSYRCLFGSITVPATVVSSTQLTCVTPALSAGQWSSLSNGDAEVSVSLSVQPASGGAQPISTISSTDFLFYDCPSYESDCARCVDQFETVKRKPACTFCFNNQACSYTSQITASCNTTGSCPFITAANPATLHTSEVQSAGVTTVLSFSGVVGTVKCAWDTGSQNVIDNSVTSTSQLLSAGQLQCTIPAGLSIGDHTVSLWTPLNSTFYRRVTPNLTFKIYDCSVNTCNLCYDATDRPKCAWCYEGLVCQFNTEVCTTHITNPATCPVITSLSLDHDVIQGGATVDVYPNYPLVAFTTINCNFNGNVHGAVHFNDTTVQCVVPPAVQAGQVNLQLESGGVAITRATNFTYYDCSLVTGGCENCITSYTSRCGWCGASCGFGNCTDSGNPVTEVCPSITSISPTVGYVDGGDPVLIRGGPFYSRQGYIYTCLFGTSIVSGEVVADPLNAEAQAVKCLTPGGGFGTVSVKVFVNGIQVHPNANVTFTFFTCDAIGGSTCSDLCTAQQYCGWCVESSSCLPQSRCTNKLFLEECVGIQLLPTHVEVSQPAQTIDIVFSPSLNFNTTGLTTNGTSTKRLVAAESGSLVPSQVECDWIGYLKTSAYIRDASTLFCSTPSIVKEATATLQILYNGVLLVPTVQYNFVSCADVDSCVECSKKELCGWCLEDNACSVDFLCTSQWVNRDCPTLESVDPAVINEAGGVNLTIDGRYFLDSPSTSVVFGNNITLFPSEINGSQIVILAPAGEAGKNVDIKVLYKGELYAVNTLIIGYTNDGSLKQDQVAGLVSGLVIGGVALAGIAVFLVLYLRRKAKKSRKGLFIEIKEPDYEKVAYLEDLNSQWRVTADDGYKFLEDVVMSRDRTFVQALAKVTTPTELDVIGRSLIYISHANGRSAEMLQFFCNETVRAAASENTIFRADNLATKMFKFYSKLVGSRYLYFTLVKLILELNTVAEEERKRQADPKELTLEVENSVSILNIEMEVDPTHLDPTKNIDTEASSLQLALFCQKIFTAIRTNTDRVPPELRHVFVKLDEVINERFGSQDAVYKAIGGMMFLRFICNGITNPHYYGLLEGPPNPIAQRQLILIAKLLQALANMSQRRENKFMETMFDFIDKNVNKMKDLYDDVLKPPNNRALNEKMQMDLKVPEQVRLNSLANMHELINRTQPKLRKIFEDIDDEDKSRAMIETLDTIVARYGDTPEKIKRQESKKKMKKQPNSRTELLSAPSSSSMKKGNPSKTELVSGPNTSSTN